MERLTRRNSHGSVLVNTANIERKSCCDNVDIVVALAIKLAEYEETGLTPKQINELMEEHKQK